MLQQLALDHGIEVRVEWNDGVSEQGDGDFNFHAIEAWQQVQSAAVEWSARPLPHNLLPISKAIKRDDDPALAAVELHDAVLDHPRARARESRLSADVRRIDVGRRDARSGYPARVQDRAHRALCRKCFPALQPDARRVLAPPPPVRLFKTAPLADTARPRPAPR